MQNMAKYYRRPNQKPTKLFLGIYPIVLQHTTILFIYILPWWFFVDIIADLFFFLYWIIDITIHVQLREALTTNNHAVVMK